MLFIEVAVAIGWFLTYFEIGITTGTIGVSFGTEFITGILLIFAVPTVVWGIIILGGTYYWRVKIGLYVYFALPIYYIFFLKQQSLQHQQSSTESKVNKSSPPSILGTKMGIRLVLSTTWVFVFVATWFASVPFILSLFMMGYCFTSDEITPKGPKTEVDLILLLIFPLRLASDIAGDLSTTPLMFKTRFTES